MRIEKLLDAWMEGYAKDGIVSVARTRSAVKYLKAHLGHMDHARLTPAALLRYRREENLEPASINRDLAVLRSALRYGVAQGAIRSAPAIPKREGAAKRVGWAPPSAIKTLIAEAGRHQGLIGFILLALTTGQRKEALLSLRWAQCDRNRGVIWFTDHELSHAGRRKGRGEVPISPGLSDLLDRLKERSGDSPYVLTNCYGNRYCDINRDHWREVTAAAGLPGLRPHDLRHTVATNLIREGVQLIHVSRLLGHANTRITEEIYVNREPQMLAPAVNVLDGLAGLR